MTTYKETIYRYRIVYHEELPEEYKASYRINGVEPDDLWHLKWSFWDKEAALEQLQIEQENAPSYKTYKMVDHGETEIIERTAWF